MREWLLRRFGMNTLGLYIQVPFCASKCSFCNFSSQVAPSAIFDPYVQALTQEILRSGNQVHSERCLGRVDTVYVGGGTPSLLGAGKIRIILETLRATFQVEDAVECTIEVTPGSADDSLLDRLLALGVNRLSIGAQSFDDRELASTGRLHSAAEIEEQVSRARKTGCGNISLDLLAGLPYQSMKTWQRSLEKTARLRPEHVSVYLFELDERSRLGKEALRHGSLYHAEALPDEDFMAEAYELAREFLNQEGYRQYEISNFALPGWESWHNQKYWQRLPYLGFGAGAHSFDGRSRWTNETSPARYCEMAPSGDSPIAEKHALSPAEETEEFFFLGLRQRKGVNLVEARRRWGGPPCDWWESRVRALEHNGWLKEEDGWLSLSDQAYLVSNEIFQQFLR